MARSFEAGQAVRVRDDYPPGHIRTPVFIRGKRGVITRDFGEHDNPEITTYQLEGPQKTLYVVRFRQIDVWPDYAGSKGDTLDIDIFEHWLEPA